MRKENRKMSSPLPSFLTWRGFGLKKNFWEYTLDIFILDKVVEFHCLNPHIPRFISAINFQDIKFRYIPLALSYSNLGGRVDIKGL